MDNTAKSQFKIHDVDSTNIVIPRPSSPRKFFARIYGHLEDDRKNSDNNRTHSKDAIVSEGGPRISFSQNNHNSINQHQHVFLERNYESNSISSSSDIEIIDVRCDSVSDQQSLSGRNNTTCEKVVNVNMNSLSEGVISNIPYRTWLNPAVPFFPNIYHQNQSFIFPNQELPFAAGLTAFLARRRRKEGRPRRQRTTFSGSQTLRLEVEYRRGEYVARARRRQLAETLALTETQVKIWFQNRRAKDKRIEKAQLDQQYRNLAAASNVYGLPVAFYGAAPCPQEPTNVSSTTQM